MARKIKETPILFGKDAKAFEKALEESKDKKVSGADFDQARDTYDRIMKASPILAR